MSPKQKKVKCDGWTDEQTNGQTDQMTNRLINQRMDGPTDRRTDVRTDKAGCSRVARDQNKAGNTARQILTIRLKLNFCLSAPC